jgi:hypothetical protein
MNRYSRDQQRYKKKFTVHGIMSNTVIAFLQDATQRQEHVYHIFSFAVVGNG